MSGRADDSERLASMAMLPICAQTPVDLFRATQTSWNLGVSMAVQRLHVLVVQQLGSRKYSRERKKRQDSDL